MPEVYAIGSELEALRIDIMAGEAESALPGVNERLAKIQDWWRRMRAGEAGLEAPDLEILARTLIGALDIAREAHFALEQWDPALKRIDESLSVEQQLQRPQED